MDLEFQFKATIIAFVITAFIFLIFILIISRWQSKKRKFYQLVRKLREVDKKLYFELLEAEKDKEKRKELFKELEEKLKEKKLLEKAEERASKTSDELIKLAVYALTLYGIED